MVAARAAITKAVAVPSIMTTAAPVTRTAPTMTEGDDARDQLGAAIRKQYFARPKELTVRAKLDSYDGLVRPNATVTDARPVQQGEHGRRMLNEIQELLSECAAIAEKSGSAGA